MKMIRPDCKFWSVFLWFRRASCVLYLWKRKKDQRVRDENILPGFVGADLPRGMRRGNWGVLGSSTVWDPSLFFLSNPSVFCNSPESATFPTHLYQQSTLDDDSNCVETLSSKSERVVQNLIQALWRWHSEKNWQMIAIFRKCHQSVVEKAARDNFMFWKRENKMKIVFSE